MSTLQRYMGRFTLPSTALDFSVNANPLSLTAGVYYIDGYDGESSGSLCDHMQTVIRTLGGPYAAATVTLGATTGKVTIDLQTVAPIVWTDTDLRDLLGFTADVAGKSIYTATNQARYIWLPSRGLSNYPMDGTRIWAPRTTSRSYRSPDGTLSTTVGHLLYDAELEHHLLDSSEVVTDSSTVWETLEQFFGDVVHNGQRIRLFPDRTDNATYVEGVWGASEDEPIGSISGRINRHISQYQGLWNVKFMLWKVV